MCGIFSFVVVVRTFFDDMVCTVSSFESDKIDLGVNPSCLAVTTGK